MISIKQIILNEIQRKELVHLCHRKNKFDPEKCIYKAFSWKSKTLFFKTGKYLQKVQIPDYSVISRMKESDEDKLKVAINTGDIYVHCSCPDFVYGGFAYLAWNGGYGIEEELRFPSIRNFQLHGSVCKHLKYLLKNIDLYIPKIATNLKNMRLKNYKMNKFKKRKKYFS